MLEAAVDRFLASPEVVPLVGGRDGAEDGEAFRRRDGRFVPVERADATYSTADLLRVEQRFVDRVVAGAGAAAGTVAPEQVERAVAQRPTMSAEQRAMVERLCLAGERVAVVVGRAGTGKTFALGVARAAWQDGGHAVVGTAVARRAAEELASGAGIASTSVAALLGHLESRRGSLPERCVLVVDEAGMVPTRQLASLLDHVEAADGTLVLVGDHRQLPALQAGGAFRGLVQRGLAVELLENRRQVERWERGALEHVREGRGAEAIALYGAHERLHVEADGDRAQRRLVCDWWEAGDPDGTAMIARRREDVADLNARARTLMRDAGVLGELEARWPSGAFAVSDRVVVKLNDFRLDVTNGERGRVVAVGEDRLTVELRGRLVRLDVDFLAGRTAQGDPTLVHGYAITGHVAQGLTVDRAFVLADDGMSREWAYTAMSRGRLANHLYLAADPHDAREEFAPSDPAPRDPIARLAAALGRSDDASLAIDVGPRDELADLDHERAVAATERRALERSRWKPGRSRRLAAARRAESVIAERVEDARRRRDELRHGSLGFVTQDELDVYEARARERIAERRAERDLGRELGR